MRTLIIGDVHGCLEELEALLTKSAFDVDEDRLIFVGDVLHKGPHSLGVLELIRELDATVIMGNHERYFLAAGGRRPLDRPMTESMAALLDEMGQDREAWLDYVESFPLYFEDKDFLVVHAGLEPNKPPKKTDPSILTTIRTWDGKGKDLNNPNDPAWFNFYREQKLVVYGHWAMQGLSLRKNTCGLDTGCLYGGHLSAIILPERRIVQVRAKKRYFGDP